MRVNSLHPVVVVVVGFESLCVQNLLIQTYEQVIFDLHHGSMNCQSKADICWSLHPPNSSLSSPRGPNLLISEVIDFCCSSLQLRFQSRSVWIR